MAPYEDAAIDRFQQGTLVSTLLALTAGLSIHTGVVAMENRVRQKGRHCWCTTGTSSAG